MASIEANQAAVLSVCGQGQRAEALFAAALERIRTSAVALEEENGHLRGLLKTVLQQLEGVQEAQRRRE